MSKLPIRKAAKIVAWVSVAAGLVAGVVSAGSCYPCDGWEVPAGALGAALAALAVWAGAAALVAVGLAGWALWRAAGVTDATAVQPIMAGVLPPALGGFQVLGARHRTGSTSAPFAFATLVRCHRHSSMPGNVCADPTAFAGGTRVFLNEGCQRCAPPRARADRRPWSCPRVWDIGTIGTFCGIVTL